MTFVSCTTSHFGLWSFLESIEHDSRWKMNVDLAQLVEHWPEDPEGTIFNEISFALPCVKICQII